MYYVIVFLQICFISNYGTKKETPIAYRTVSFKTKKNECSAVSFFIKFNPWSISIFVPLEHPWPQNGPITFFSIVNDSGKVF